MAQTRTTAFATAADAADSAPVLLVRALLSGGTRYWTSRAGTYGAQVYTELLKRGLDVTLGMDAIGRTMRGIGRLELANESDGTGVRLSDILATDVVSARAVEVDLLMYGLTHPTDSVRLFSGMLEVPETDCFDDESLRLNLLDDGNPLWAGIQDLACARIHKILGDKITAAAYPDADPDVLGRVKPLLYGAVADTPALAVDAGAADLLQIDHDASVATVTCSDATRFAQFPASGTVICEGEEITYTGKGTLTLTTCTRGTGGTTASAHSAGATVYEKKATYTYLLSPRPCKSVGNVRVDGILKTLTTDYTVSLAGPTTITFTVRPKSVTPVAVTEQPVFGATVTAEQSPGSVTVTAEQTPGSVTVSAEHSHTTDTGSHDHVVGSVITEYPTYPSLGGGTVGFSATTAVTFVNTPKSGSANWYANVNNKSGTWTLAGQTLGVGEQWWTQASPTQDDQLSEISAGTISLFEIRREITVAGAADAHAASGVVAGRSGSTAASMAALSGSTAANMATLAGSTAVSVARTTNVAVSAADIVIGSEVLCDVEGEVDDGSGTFTGTPNALIVNPADQILHIVNIHLGLTLADWIDTTSFAAARAAFAASAIRCDWGLYEQIDSAELLERLRWSVGSRLFQGSAGKFKLYPLPLTATSAKTFTEAADILGPGSGGGPITVGRTGLSDLYNQVYVLYAKIVTGGTGYAGYDTSSDATSVSTYRMTRTLIIENDFVRDATAAAAIGDIYLAWHKDQKWRATMIADGIPCAHLEPCDKVSITSSRMPGVWTAKAFFVESIAMRMVPPGQKSTATLVCREA